MRYLLVWLVAFSAFSSHAEVDVNYDKNLVSLQAKIEQLTDEVERLKQNQKLEVSLLNQRILRVLNKQ